MLKVSEYEIMELFLLINKDNPLGDNVDEMLKSENQLSNKVGKIMKYMGLKTISDVDNRVKMYRYNEENL